ncbi:TolC family protein, partial [Francisella tularensis subsp. holarctica]|nr:TolC family protein [Francisella tularensis subsp. holarctica]
IQIIPAIKLCRLLPSIYIGGSITATNFLDKRTIADGDIAGGRFDSIQGLVNLTQPLYDYGAYKDLQSAEETAQLAQQDY